jgi:hypothetical protein
MRGVNLLFEGVLSYFFLVADFFFLLPDVGGGLSMTHFAALNPYSAASVSVGHFFSEYFPIGHAKCAELATTLHGSHSWSTCFTNTTIACDLYVKS